MSLSDELRRGARGDRARARLRPPRRALRALPRRRPPPPARPRRGRRPSRRLRARRSRAARSRCCARSASSPRSAPTARRAFDRATRYQLHVPGTRAALATLHEAGVVSTRARVRSSGRRSASSAAPCCRRRLPARRAARRRARSAGRGARTSRSARATPAGAELPRPARRPQRTSSSDVHERGRHAIAYAKGTEAIADVLALAGAGDARARARGAGGRRRGARAARTGSRTPTTPNLVRTGRAAHAQLEAIRRSSVRPPRRAPAELREIAELRAAPSVALTRGARREVQPAGDEGDRPPATPPVVSARRRRGSIRYKSLALRGPMRHTSARRVRARPAVDSDPVCRQVPSAVNRRGRSSSELPLRPAAASADEHCGGLLRSSPR